MSSCAARREVREIASDPFPAFVPAIAHYALANLATPATHVRIDVRRACFIMSRHILLRCVMMHAPPSDAAVSFLPELRDATMVCLRLWKYTSCYAMLPFCHGLVSI